MNFWDNNHPLAADSTRLYAELVPSSGKCSTLQGELLRASNKISYDWFNNGWGCNNWSGAANFLQEYALDLSSKRTVGECNAFKIALSRVHDFSHGERVSIKDDDADAIVTTIHAFVVQNVLDNPEPVVNSFDMWDFSEPDAPYLSEDDYDEEDGY